MCACPVMSGLLWLFWGVMAIIVLGRLYIEVGLYFVGKNDRYAAIPWGPLFWLKDRLIRRRNYRKNHNRP